VEFEQMTTERQKYILDFEMNKVFNFIPIPYFHYINKNIYFARYGRNL